MASNYPPGVTGNEWEIAGYPPCGRTICGHLDEDHVEPVEEPPGSGILVAPASCAVEGCACEEYTPYSDEPDPDWMHDRE